MTGPTMFASATPTKSTIATTARVLQLAGALVAIGSYVSEPANLSALSPTTAHYLALVGGVAYVVGRALESYLAHQQINQNTQAIASTPIPNPLAKP